MVTLYNAYAVIAAADSQACALFAGLTTPVDGNQEIMVAAFYVERNLPVIANHNGAGIKAVRRYGSQDKASALSEAGISGEANTWRASGLASKNPAADCAPSTACSSWPRESANSMYALA